MLNIFPYIFSTTFNTIANNMNVIDNIVDNVVNNIVNSDFMDNLVKNIDNMAPVEVQFKEHKRGYTIQCYLPGTKKENISLEYDNNYITLQVKRNMFYSNNQNIAVAIVQAGGDVNEDYYVENADPSGIRAVFKNDTLNVLIPKSTYISKDTTIVDVDAFKE
ncbi:Hsp20 family protein [Clostridium sp. 1001271B_151109_B4]|uniref:Hsp20 family protein n=1 Tax=Clostridium sp. 1001271B_151109_B4 TaxID=2787148 RepID=UPI0018AB73D5|nr:Hsp20 family protein [Clostridium sp. 1001271B_151109_B4]